MSDTIDRATVQRVARLARLRLSDAEQDSLVDDLQRIVAYVEKLQSVDTSAIQPLVHMTIDAMPARKDVAGQPLGTDKALANAPEAADDAFVVPRVVGS